MSKRAALINNLDRLKEEFPLQFADVDINWAEIYIDVQDRKERRSIVEILRECRKRLPLIIKIILQNKYNEDYYAPEPEGTLAIKFKHGKVNSRIYCLEFGAPNRKKKVVMVRGIKNKADLDKGIKKQLKAIKDYEYEFFKSSKDAIKHRQQQ